MTRDVRVTGRALIVLWGIPIYFRRCECSAPIRIGLGHLGRTLRRIVLPAGHVTNGIGGGQAVLFGTVPFGTGTFPPVVGKKQVGCLHGAMLLSLHCVPSGDDRFFVGCPSVQSMEFAYIAPSGRIVR